MPIKKSYIPYSSVQELVNDNKPYLLRQVNKPKMSLFSYDRLNLTSNDIANMFLDKALNWLPYQALCDISIGYILHYKNENPNEEDEEYYR